MFDLLVKSSFIQVFPKKLKGRSYSLSTRLTLNSVIRKNAQFFITVRRRTFQKPVFLLIFICIHPFQPMCENVWTTVMEFYLLPGLLIRHIHWDRIVFLLPLRGLFQWCDGRVVRPDWLAIQVLHFVSYNELWGFAVRNYKFEGWDFVHLIFTWIAKLLLM
jgi:hypothetical protein